MPKRKRATRSTAEPKRRCGPPVLVITGAPGVGKTHLVKAVVLRSDEKSFHDRFVLVKHGINPQVVYAAEAKGKVVVVGGYKYPDDQKLWRKRSGTEPANGGTDTLTPQSTGLLARLLRGELHAQGEAPRLIVMEACAKAKLGRKSVLEALLDASSLDILELQRPAAEAVAALAARSHAADGKGVKGMPPDKTHAKFAAQVDDVRAAFEKRADARSGPSRAKAWRQLNYEEARAEVEARMAAAMA